MFEKFCNTLIWLAFSLSPYDPSMFTHHTAHGTIILLVYVDDIIIIGTHSDMIRQLQSSLQEAFHMKALGPLTDLLELEVHQTKT